MCLSRILVGCILLVSACSSQGSDASQQDAVVPTSDCSQLELEINSLSRACVEDSECTVVHDEFSKNIYCSVPVSSREAPEYKSLRQHWVQIGCDVNETIDCAARMPAAICTMGICTLD
jgi:hypothetical protein